VMLNRNRVLGVLLLLVMGATAGYADQPRMTAARADLQQAKRELQVALRNKAGHRERAIGLINSAIAEINAGIRFDRRHNHATSPMCESFRFVTTLDQVHMQKALDHLRDARSNLNAATTAKGGHRVKALGYIEEAINEVKKGIDAGE
jgi:hypothetical protein